MSCAKRGEANGSTPFASRATKQIARKAPSHPGCGKMRRLLRRAPRHRSPSYDLRRAPRIHPHFARNAIRVGLVQRFLRSLARAEQLWLERRALFQRTDAHRKLTELAIEKIVAQRARNRAQSDLAPRYIRLVVQLD